MEKKKWGKPKLIVLARNKPEENILVDCKSLLFSAGANNSNSMCLNADPECNTVCSVTGLT